MQHNAHVIAHRNHDITRALAAIMDVLGAYDVEWGWNDWSDAAACGLWY